MELGIDGVETRPVRLVVSDDLQRGRGSVFFRLWFAIPFIFWLTLWGIAAFFVAIANWFATLFKGTSPQALHGFLARFVRFAVHTYAYLYLAAEPLPGFGGRPGYPIDVEIDPPVRQNRWKVGFRLVLVVPALILLAVFFGTSGGVSGASEARTGRVGLLFAAYGRDFRACPSRAPDRFYAIAHLAGVTVGVNLIHCTRCTGPGSGPYNSLKGMKAIVRGLKPREPVLFGMPARR